MLILQKGTAKYVLFDGQESGTTDLIDTFDTAQEAADYIEVCYPGEVIHWQLDSQNA